MDCQFDYGYDYETQYTNWTFKLLYNYLEIYWKFLEHAKNLYFKQPKLVLKIKIKTKVKKSWLKSDLLQCTLSEIETAATPAPSVVKKMN